MDKQTKIPQVRFPEFKEDWEIKRFDEFLIHTPRPKPKPKNNYLSIGLRSHFKGTFQKPNTDPNKNAMDTLYEIKENDFIVNITFAWEGALAIVTKDDNGGFVSHRFPTYNFKKGFNNLFFKYHFFQEKSKHQLGIVSPGGAGRNRVMNKTDFIKLKLPFPTLPEQKKIAHFFSIVDKKISQLQDKKNALELYKKGMMQQIFSQELRFKPVLSEVEGDDTSTSLSTGNGQDFPDWEEKKLGDLLIFKNGINAPKESYGKGFKFINVLDIINNSYITSDNIIGSVDVSQEVFDKNMVEYGDILFQRSSETREEVGQSNVYLDLHKKVTFGGFVIRGKKNGDYVPSFLNLLLKTSMARKDITSKSGGSTRYNVGQGILSSIALLFPCLEEQTKIANFLTKIDAKINAVNQQIAQSKTYKKGLLQKMFVN